MKKKIALITGITGQDGSYLAELLIKKNYIVHGLRRRSSVFNTERINNIYKDPYLSKKKLNFFLHYGDLTDSNSLFRIINSILPDEIYNLAAQSHVHVSFENPEYTSNVDALGTVRLLEIVRELKNKKKMKFYQASSSEMFGKVLQIPQNENTPFNPVSPYAVSKIFSYYMTKLYREAYNIYAVSGILFNHESYRRGKTFVTKKIIRGLTRIKMGLQDKIIIGNVNAKRDWGHAKDYVFAQWLMMQSKVPKDYVIATGMQYSVKDLINTTCKILKIKHVWIGKGLNEKVINKKTKKIIVEVSKKYFRPNEVDDLLGDPSMAIKELKWKPKYNFHKLIAEMINIEIKEIKNNKIDL
tara:strand:- start:7425 stop:8489 length:1065 start_codon:yes stop_codon:yes gene_type:complete